MQDKVKKEHIVANMWRTNITRQLYATLKCATSSTLIIFHLLQIFEGKELKSRDSNVLCFPKSIESRWHPSSDLYVYHLSPRSNPGLPTKSPASGQWCSPSIPTWSTPGIYARQMPLRPLLSEMYRCIETSLWGLHCKSLCLMPQDKNARQDYLLFEY